MTAWIILISLYVLWAGEFQDRQRLWRRIQSDRQFDVVLDPTASSFESSSKSVTDARAVLLVSGTLCEGVSPSDYHASALSEGVGMGQSVADVPGIVAKIYLQGAPDVVKGKAATSIGGCYLFEDETAMEAFVASDQWEATRSTTPWEKVSVERFVVAGVEAPTAAGA